MFEALKVTPSKKMNRFYLVFGFVAFFIIYSSILKYFQEFSFTPDEFNLVWFSFDAKQFSGLILTLMEADKLEMFRKMFVLNIFSIAAFTIGLFALLVIIARSFDDTSKLYKFAYFVPILPLLIAFFDIGPSIFMVAISDATLENFPIWLAYIMSGGYVIRVLVLYFLVFWLLFALIRFILKTFKKK